MDEYIRKDKIIQDIEEEIGISNMALDEDVWFNRGLKTALSYIKKLPAADVQPLSIVAEHIKKRLYETAFNTTEEKARNAIADMAGRIDFWIDELRDGDTNG